MSPEEAVEFARNNFPSGPELLADHLGISVRYSDTGDCCDGWCLSFEDRSVIRINSGQVSARRRFTLAHELGHLILGVPSIVGESFQEMLQSNSKEEILVNRLAAELLMPLEIVKKFIKRPPVAAQSLVRLAKAANVSPLSAALRVVNSAIELGVGKAAVILFEGDEYKWERSLTIEAKNKNTYLDILKNAREVHPSPYRRLQNGGQTVFASIIHNPRFNQSTLFIQLLDLEQGSAQSHDERRNQLESELFGSGNVSRPSLEGCLSTIKQIAAGSLDHAEAAFWDRYADKFSQTLMMSANGKEYIRLRLSLWFS